MQRRSWLALSGVFVAFLFACVGDSPTTVPQDAGGGNDVGVPTDGSASDGGDGGVPGAPLWLTHLAGDDVQAWSVTTDAEGAVYVVGVFTGKLTIGSDGFTSQGTRDTFFTKLDSSGVPQWTKTFGGAGTSTSGRSIACDGTNVYIGVDFQNGPVTVGPTTLTANGDGKTDFFVGKFDKSGNHIAQVVATGVGDQHVSTLLPLADGIFITGNNDGTITNFLGLGNATATGPRDLLLARAFTKATDSVSQYPGNGNATISGSPVGPFAMGGYIGNSVDIGGRVLTMPDAGGSAGITVWFTGAMAAQWATVVAPTKGAIGALDGVHIDGAGSVYLDGFVNGTFILPDDSTVVGPTDTQHPVGFLAKMDTNAKVVWKKVFSNSSFGPLAHDRQNRIFACGSTNGDTDFGGGAVKNQGGRDAAIVGFTTAGTFAFARTYGDANNQVCSRVHVDAKDDVLATGLFQGAITLGTSTIASTGTYNGYVAKFRAP